MSNKKINFLHFLQLKKVSLRSGVVAKYGKIKCPFSVRGATNLLED